MPLEPLPWDRRDFGKPDRPGSEPRLAGGGFGGGGPHRWRQQQQHPNAPPPPYYQQRQQQRWYSDIHSSRLPPPGNGKHGGRHMYSDDAGQGYMPFGSRYAADRNLEDENFRSFGARNDGGYFRNNRENRGSFSQKDWKARSWGPSPTRGSCFSHSSSSKSVAVGSTEIVADVQPKNAALGRSLPDERSASPAQCKEVESRKRPRLGWGQGLAKLEKKEVEGPEDAAPKNELICRVTCTETMQSQSVRLSEKRPRVASLSDCAFPVTPSLVACSSSPGVEEKEFAKEANMGWDRTTLSCSPSIASHTHYNAPTFNLENLELAPISDVSSLIEELLQSNDPASADTGYVRITSMNKLLVWKVDMLKALELTESEIESLETELKSLIAEPRICCPPGSHLLPGEEQLKDCEGLVNSSKCGIKLDPLQINSCGKIIVENEPVGPEDVDVASKDEEFIEGSLNLDVNVSSNLNEICLKNSRNYEEYSGYSGTTTREDLAGVSNVHYDVDNIHDLIFSSNRDTARRATDQLNKLLPKYHNFDSSIECISSLGSDSSIVEEKFLRRRRCLQFKEKVLTIKFKVFQHFWKEGRWLGSIRKLRGKTQKKFGLRRNGHKNNLSSFCSRASSYAGGPQKVPADEVIEYVNGLLSESTFRPYRNTLKMPALILDKEVKMSRFISNNGLMEDPCGVEKERSMINPWTSQEKDIFIDKLSAFGKDFTKIASFLDHKTVADCIEFYYKNHKSECFEKARKSFGCTKQRMYLVGSGKRRNPELNAASLDILSAASEIVANIDNGTKSCKAPTIDDCLLQGSDSTNTYSDERETEAADVLASICGSLSSEAVSSCITSCVDHPTIRPLTPEVTQDVDDECSDESWAELNLADWSDEEKSIFIRAVSIYGKDFSMISQYLGTRSMDQCKSFFSKARKCLGLDLIQPGPGSELGDGDGDGDGDDDDDGNDDSDDDGDGDIEDGCTMETLPVICNNGSECGTMPCPQPSGNVSHSYIPIKCLETPNHSSLSAFGANGISGTQSPQTVSTVDWQRHLPGWSLSDSTESSQILQGHPVNLNSDWHTDSFLERCDGSRQQSYAAEALFPSGEQIREPSRNGDVKLFGTILISSEQKTNNFTEQTDSTQSKFDYKSRGGTANSPVGSFRLWDENEGQTETPPLPDSALLLAKYPAAFYAPKLEQPFAMDMKQRQNVFSETPKGKVFDLRGFSEINIGGQCSSASDAVDAFKMQYGKTEQ